MNDVKWSKAGQQIRKVLEDLEEQYRGWLDMVVFKRQWILRDFKIVAGMLVEQWLNTLRALRKAITSEDGPSVVPLIPPFDRLIAQCGHMKDLLSEYDKDPEKRKAGTVIIQDWIRSVDELPSTLSSPIQPP